MGDTQILQQIEQFRSNLEKHRDLNCVISDLSDIAVQNLDKISEEQKNGLLIGKLIAVKDNLNLIGSETTCASNILAGHKSIFNATVIDRIQQAGGTIIAKTNMDEFAMGSSTEHSCFGPTKNPVNPDYVPGGSSGGSAVAVASGLVEMALGSDTGGSVRQPASFCGIYGLKPTYGRLSRYGLVAFASSFDQIGVFGNTTENTALLFEVTAGVDENDSTSVDIPVEHFEYDEVTARKLKIGIPEEYQGEGIDPEVRQIFDKFINYLKDEGISVEKVSMPFTDKSIAAYYILTTAEASSNLARYDGIRFGPSQRNGNLEDMYKDTRTSGFGDEVKRRIMLGTFVLSSGYYDAYYTKAQKVRNLIRNDFVNAFEKVDLLFTPTSPFPAFKIGAKVDNPLKMYLADIFTVPMSLAGVPALNIPAGKNSNGLPIGLQLTANYYKETSLFQLSNFLELNFN